MSKMKELWALQVEMDIETEDLCVESFVKAIAGLKYTLEGLEKNHDLFKRDNEAGAEAVSHVIRGLRSDIELFQTLIKIYNKE